MNRRNEKGYSLVEIAIVMALIGIVAMLGVPSYRQLIPRYRFQAAVSTMASEMNLTRLKAVSQNREFKVKADKTNDTLIVYKGNASSGSTTWNFDNQSHPMSELDIYDVVSIINDEVIFMPDGTMDESAEGGAADGLGLIYFQGPETDLKKRLHIYAATGRVTVERYQGGAWKDERYLKE